MMAISVAYRASKHGDAAKDLRLPFLQIAFGWVVRLMVGWLEHSTGRPTRGRAARGRTPSVTRPAQSDPLQSLASPESGPSRVAVRGLQKLEYQGMDQPIATNPRRLTRTTSPPDTQVPVTVLLILRRPSRGRSTPTRQRECVERFRRLCASFDARHATV